MDKREREREELHRAIWAIADELRGAVDGWDFKNYVLGAMFYRWLSEDLTAHVKKTEREGFEDYVKLSDDEAEKDFRENLVNTKGFFILPSELFCNVLARAERDETERENLNETLGNVFRHIEGSATGKESEAHIKGLFADFDVNSNKLGSGVKKRNECLMKLLRGIANMNLGVVSERANDTFGDAYEYLMNMYASNAGKSGGEFFTPADVSELLIRLGTVGKREIGRIYDPACGSGSLLLGAKKVLSEEEAKFVKYYGQEINVTTYNLCRMNMFLHGINFPKFHIACDDTLIRPHFREEKETFDLIVSNPPYSVKWAGDDDPALIAKDRFSPAAVFTPKSKADLAFVMHSLYYLATSGTAAIVCFPGILYRGGAERKIREYLVTGTNVIDCIIQLPSNLFFGTSIATCILVLKKCKTDNKILFIDASKECVKVTNNNRLTKENIRNIIEVFAGRKDVKHVSRLVSSDEIKENDFNLSVSTYVEAEDTREKIDIVELNREIAGIVDREVKLRTEIDGIVAEIEGTR